MSAGFAFPLGDYFFGVCNHRMVGASKEICECRGGKDDNFAEEENNK